MSMELFNETTFICRKVSKEFWGKALELARINGWNPMGTRPPLTFNSFELNAIWNGTYLTNDGQLVVREDALLLAEALHRSLDDIPDTYIRMDLDPTLWQESDLPEWLSPEEIEIFEAGLEAFSFVVVDIHPFKFFAGNEKKYLTELIRFCRLGSFAIL
jgi:hypothetical protein